MPWTCPACGNHIRHDGEGEPPPKLRLLYPCYVCRIELVFEPNIGKMRPAPVSPEPKRSDAALAAWSLKNSSIWRRRRLRAFTAGHTMPSRAQPVKRIRATADRHAANGWRRSISGGPSATV